MQTPNNRYAQLRAWFRTCPVLNKKFHLRVDYSADTPTEYAIYALPSTIAYRENVLGEMIPNDIQEINFIFASNEYWGADEKQNLENHTVYQEIVAWVNEQNALQNFPKIPEGRVKSIVPTLTQYVTEVSANTARYQIQLKMSYKRY